ncbi:F1F0 ATP synthase associated 60.6kDa protein, partial [Monoraphidium neglectum]
MLRQGAEPLLPQQARSFFSLSLEFSEDVSASKPKAGGGDLLKAWSSKKAETEAALKLLTTYKDLGDLAGEPYIQNHNPRTFEDLSKPIPNFKKFGLKAGEVPKFFDGVLQARAADAVAAKDAWWAERRANAEEAVKERKFT